MHWNVVGILLTRMIAFSNVLIISTILIFVFCVHGIIFYILEFSFFIHSPIFHKMMILYHLLGIFQGFEMLLYMR